MNVKDHYNQLIEENNDPFRDPPVLQEYMSKWDGQTFIDFMCLSPEKKVLEIGVGTGRIAAKVIPYCSKLIGIDISPKTIERATENLSCFDNLELICSDFSDYAFNETFDIIYSSLTLMHFEDKRHFIFKVDNLLNIGGTFCLSIDKNQNDYIDMGTRKLKIYPDKIDTIITFIHLSSMKIITQHETEFAHIIVCSK